MNICQDPLYLNQGVYAPLISTNPPPSAPFVKIYVDMIDGSPLSDRAFRLFALLKRSSWRTGSTDLSQAELSAALRCSIRSVQRALKELEDMELISVEQRGLNLTNRILVPESVEERQPRKAPPLAPRPSPRAASAAASPVPPRRHAGHDTGVTADTTRVSPPTCQIDACIDNPSPAAAQLPPDEAPARPEPSPVVAALIKTGMAPYLAQTVVKQYGPDPCQRALALLQRETNVRHKGRWLYAAITRGYESDHPSALPRAVRKVTVVPVLTEEARRAAQERVQEEKRRAMESLPPHLRERLQRRRAAC